MKFAHFFVNRPIFAAVLSIIILIAGGIALTQLPISQYPEVVPPTVVVNAHYPGANPQTIAQTVATPIEQEVNGVEDMLYMSSSSTSDGTMNLTITFKLGTDLDKAQVQVQNRVSIAVAKLPEEVRRLGVTTNKQSPDLSLVVHLVSPNNRYDELYIGNYAFLQVKDELARVPGVGQVQVFGARDYSMRIWIDPDKAATRNLTASDVVNAIREQNVQVAAGTIGQPPMPSGTELQFSVLTQGRLANEKEFGDIIIRNGGDGKVIRVRDVARVELAARDYTMDSLLNGKPATALVVFQLPGSNALKTAQGIYAKMEDLKRRFPPGLDYQIVYDTTTFVTQSVDAVKHTLFEAIILVVIVVLCFLQTWRASLIPMLAVPVSLVGTFAVMHLLGFSLNNLTLFGLVLAIGIVVDDAIVVVENVERNIADGLDPKAATYKAMDEVSGPVIAVALVLCAVFIPTAFISGITGQFYRQFALTIAVSTVISAFNSLTLSPALAALLLKPHHAKPDWFTRFLNFFLGWFFKGFNWTFTKATNGYHKFLGRTLRFAVIALIAYGALIGLTWFGFKQVPTGFIPVQDKGYLAIFVQLPDGASLERTTEVIKKVSKIALETKGITSSVEFPGFSLLAGSNVSNAGSVFCCFDDFSKRTDPSLNGLAIVNTLQEKLGGIQEAFIGVFPPPPVNGLGSTGGFKLMIQDVKSQGLDALQGQAFNMMEKANGIHGMAQAFTTMRATVPQLFVDVDRTKAKSMGVPLNEIFDTMQIYLGSLYVNDFNRFGRTYQVTAQADAKFRTQPETIRLLKTRNADGQMVPLGTLATIKQTNGADQVVHYNMFTSADLIGATQPGVSAGDVTESVEALARAELPDGYKIEWTDLTYQEKLAGNTSAIIFPLCVLFVFLVLAALYESWSLPFAIILIVPMCLLSAIVGVWTRGMDNNIFTQIGLVVLVGLACKNAILIVEFAKQLQDAGRSRIDAALEAARLRLRPILMTSFAFILGVVPLVRAQGAGAEMRQALGTTVFSGMLGVTFFGIILTPVFYVSIMWFKERRKKVVPVEVPPAS